jgi:ATP-dependent DNA ligase
VVEVGFNHFDGGRLRYPAHFLRWRPDKTVRECRFDQMDAIAPYELKVILGMED